MTLAWPKSRSALTKYKRSGSSFKSKRGTPPYAIPGTAVRVNLSKPRNASEKKETSENENSKRKKNLRAITSNVFTYRHEVFSIPGFWPYRSQPLQPTYRIEPSFQIKYSVGDVLGKGGFGVVYSGIRRLDGAPVAIKHVARNKVIEWAEVNGNQVPNELKFLLEVQDVDGVVKLLDFYERDDSFIYVMEKPHHYVDMFDYITKAKTLDEVVARNFFRQVVDTVVACHERGIVHRDIKDENLLVDLTSHKVTLIDFGSGGYIQREDYHQFDGTRVYAPPEWIRDGRYRWEGLTVWSLGILLFDMVAGDVPFQEDGDICQAQLKFPAGLSRGVKDLIQGSLHPDERYRLSMGEIERHPWVRGDDMNDSGIGSL